MNDLHRDLLNESAPEFRDHLLARTLATSRRTRRMRAVAKASFGLSLSILAVLILLPRYRQPESVAQTVPPPESSVANPAARTYTIIQTQPFASVIETRPLPAKFYVASLSPIKVLESNSRPDITLLNDDQLLALFTGKPVALVAGPKGEELILLEPRPPISN